MQRKILFKINLLVLLFIFFDINISFAGQTAQNFFKSFIDSYDLSGRYTHEYHPFILKKTRNSFLELEKFLRDFGFSIEGHELIIGYQEDAVEPYETKWCRDAIEDEAVVKNHAGLCLPTKNIFGFMTGFIFKDASILEKKWSKDQKNIKINHIGADSISLFHDDALIFQKHAFGKDFDLLIKSRNAVEHAIYKSDIKKILKELVNFWSLIYKNASTTSANNVIGTQDILFSIDYAKGIIKSCSDIKKIFIGPDITYPIEVLDCQKSNATIYAQKFIKEFEQALKPINNCNTAYIFCSFVDGVGKSTLLNNIKNYQSYSNDLKKYKRCDNSSSQEATIYELKDKVFLVDLPAQMSHFVFKPDGYVYVDIQTAKDISNDQLKRISNHVKLNKKKLIEQFNNLKQQIASTSYALYQYNKPLEQYIHNCLTLQLNEIKWIPFEFEGQNFLFNNESCELKILVPIAGVHSIGLKVVEPEQMLFAHGLSLPMKYNSFLDDLKNKLSQSKIKHVVFVDFLSMYPRSSRENIRINFILQYLKKIYQARYDLNNSFYKHKVHQEQEICHLLCNKLDQATVMLVLETVFRYACFKLLKKVPISSLTSLKDKNLEDHLVDYCKKILKKYAKDLEIITKQRLEVDQAVYYQKYGLDKTYENIIRFSADPLVKFSSIMVALWTKFVTNQFINDLWRPAKELFDKIDSGQDVKNIYKKDFDLLYKIHALTKDEDELKIAFRTINAQWFATLENLLNVQTTQEGNLLAKITQYVPPLIVTKSSDGYLYVLQRKFKYLVQDPDNELKAPLLYHLTDEDQPNRKWGLVPLGLPDAMIDKSKDYFCLDWSNIGTFFGIYAFGFWPINPSKEIVTKVVLNYKKLCLKKGNGNFGMPASQLYQKIINDEKLKEKLTKEINFINKTFQTSIKPQVIDINDTKIEAIKLWVRMIATLNMILKDPESEIFVVKGDKPDFIAAIKLLEKITLLKFYGIELKQSLFEDYITVEPVIPWHELKDT